MHWCGDVLHPLPQRLPATCFFTKNSASISISFLIFEGRAGAGGRERAAVISTEAGLVLRGIRDTQVFSQRALCRALLEPSSIPVCQTTLSRGVRYPEPVSNAKSSNGGEKKNKGREEGRRGMWRKGKGGKCSSSKKKVVVPTWLFLFKIIS